MLVFRGVALENLISDIGMIMTLRPIKTQHNEATNIFFINAESVICDLLISSGEGSFDEELLSGCEFHKSTY